MNELGGRMPYDQAQMGVETGRKEDLWVGGPRAMELEARRINSRQFVMSKTVTVYRGTFGPWEAVSRQSLAVFPRRTCRRKGRLND